VLVVLQDDVQGDRRSVLDRDLEVLLCVHLHKAIVYARIVQLEDGTSEGGLYLEAEGVPIFHLNVKVSELLTTLAALNRNLHIHLFF